MAGQNYNMFKKKPLVAYGTGLVESPRDPRDVLLSAVSPIPVRIPPVCPAPFDLDILNQGQTPHCVGFASACMKQEKELREKNSQIFDGDWIYAKAKTIDGMPDFDGTYFRAGLQVLQKFGAKPLNGTEADADKFKIGTYALVDDASFDGLKKAIFVNGAILCGFRGTNQGWQTAYIRPPKTGEAVWGHATTLIGYNEGYLIGQNSWGKLWGENGLFYVGQNYLSYLVEAWAVLTDLPLIIKEGYVAQSLVRNTDMGVGSQISPITAINFRDKPALTGNILGILKPLDKLEVLELAGQSGGYSWLKVKIK